MRATKKQASGSGTRSVHHPGMMKMRIAAIQPTLDAEVTNNFASETTFIAFDIQLQKFLQLSALNH
jgi:hypothetical protein